MVYLFKKENKPFIFVSVKTGILKSQSPFALLVKGDKVGRKNAHLSSKLTLPPVVLWVGLCDDGDAITHRKAQVARLLPCERMHGRD